MFHILDCLKPVKSLGKTSSEASSKNAWNMLYSAKK